jgi:hypothetical protein
VLRAVLDANIIISALIQRVRADFDQFAREVTAARSLTGGRHLFSPFGLLVYGRRDLELAIENMRSWVDGHSPTQFAVKV